jgi:cellulose synthase/poly-beta-1,6-N-acetylglucosamine synthase-like glycosyltransferase
MRRVARKPWNITKTDYFPKVSIIVPTYNESEVIKYKLKNLAGLDYPKNLTELIFIDSKSTDSTIDLIKKFDDTHPDINIKILVENERRGKTSALNEALKNCTGDVVVVTDADCFLPSNILRKSLSYLSDPTIGAVSGPKILLNSDKSWVTKTEDRYLQSANLVKLGESKASSTLLFEGGFSAYKRETFEAFDPYKTGSDDCGTVIRLLEKNMRAIMVPEAQFYTTFPETFGGRLEIKVRRANQIIRVFYKYASLTFQNQIRNTRGTIFKNLVIYTLCPLAFLFFMITTTWLFIDFPFMSLLMLIFLVPKARSYIVEVALNYVVMLYSFFSVISRTKFVVWKKPQDRALINEAMLLKNGLI